MTGPIALRDIAPVKTRNHETGLWEGEHAFIAGITGFGKSFLVKKLDALRTFTIIHDFKNEIIMPGRLRVDRLSKLMAADPIKHPKVIYAPMRTEARDPFAMDRLCEWVYKRGNTTLILDELNAMATSRTDMPDYLYELYARARTKGCEVWAITQEPVWVPKIARTQTKHRYCFYLADEAHQKVMTGLLPGIAAKTSDAAAAIANLRKKQFLYYRLGERAARGPYELAVRSGETLVDAA